MKLINFYNKKNNYLFILFIFLPFFLINLIFIFFFPGISGDAKVIKIVAENILNNQCISLSDPLTKKCIPHWGSNQGPGYPFLLATTWFFFGKNILSLKILQLFIHFFSVIYLAIQIKKNYKIDNLIIVYTFLCFSPITMGWHRYILTESLIFSLTIFLIATLVPLFCKNKVNLFFLSLIISVGFYVRYDFVLWSVPIALIYLYVHKFRQTLIDCLKIFFISMILVMPYLLRNYLVNLEFIPPTQIGLNVEGNFFYPEGYVSWINTWATTNYMVANALYPIDKGNYKLIKIHPNAYYDINEKNKVETNLVLLQKYEGKKFPIEIDKNFRNIVSDKKNNYPIKIYLLNPLKKSISLWLNPVTSLGFPGSLNNSDISIDTLYNKKAIDQYSFLKENFLVILGKTLNFFHRIFIVCSLISIPYFIYKKKKHYLKPLMLFTLTCVFLKTIFLSYTIYIETRHIVPLGITIEVFIIIFLLTRNKTSLK